MSTSSVAEEEQRLLRQIEELKKSTAPDATTTRAQLERRLARLHGTDAATLESENIALKKRLQTLEKTHAELQTKYTELRKNFGTLAPQDENRATPDAQKLARLHEMLLKKFAPLINEREQKTVGDIKALVNPDDLTVQSILEEIRPEGYSFERDYEPTAQKALSYLNEEIAYVRPKLGINFWLEPKEMLEYGVSDDEDLAVLLCTLLYALGDEHAQVVIAELDNLTTHAFVLTTHEGKTVLLDPSTSHGFAKYAGKKEEVLAKYRFEGAGIRRFIYKFNREHYEQLI